MRPELLHITLFAKSSYFCRQYDTHNMNKGWAIVVAGLIIVSVGPLVTFASEASSNGGKMTGGCFGEECEEYCNINECTVSEEKSDQCIWPECYVPYDNIQQYGTDDNCKAPNCLIRLEDGVQISPTPGSQPLNQNEPNPDQCLWPECYVPYDNIQQYGTDDNCKAPNCLIRLEDGVQVAQSPGGQHPPSPRDLFDNRNMCKWVAKYLERPCSFYVDSNGVLSAEGKRAKDCIRGGMAIGGAALYLNLPPLGIIKELKDASKNLSDCDHIVKWSIIENDVRSATAFLELMQLIS